MDDDLDQLLASLKLGRIRQILDERLAAATAEGPSYGEFLRRLLREERHAQQLRFLEGRVARAKLPERWSLDTFPWDHQPGVRRAVIEQLATLDFVGHGQNIVFVGPTGVGKTGLASGILLQALFAGRRGLFVKAQDLFEDMYRSLADHSSRKLLDYLARVELLVIDEMGYLNLRPEQSNIFFKLMEERYLSKASTIITTNLDYEEWYAFLGQKAMVGALLDRLRHRCTTVPIDGPSLRTPQT
ncbi:MAG: ATP-binding protein [Deltaproteobacteria bacterium]|nr:ATP-binding protein [Deltaproteobacteria bacterium]